MTALILTLIVKASVIMAVAGIAAVLSKRASAAKRHMLLAISVASLLALPVLTVLLPSLKIPVAAGASVSRIAAAAKEIDAPQQISSPRRGSSAAVALVDAETAPQAQAPTSPGLPASSLSWAEILFALYAVGVTVLGVKLATEHAAVRRLTRRSTEMVDPEWMALVDTCRHEHGMFRPVRVLRSLDKTMPMAFGIVAPTILIPSIADTWTLDRRRAVLLHELAHIARRDCLSQLVTRIACAVYWPHPGAWLIARRLRIERELACDDRVLSIGTAAPDYAQHLLELAYSLGGYRAPALVVSMARPKQLEGRMLAVLDRARNRTTPAVRIRVAACLVAGLIVLPLAAARITAAPDAVTYIAEIGEAAAPDPAPPQSKEQSKVVREAQKRREIQLPGTWSVRPTKTPGIVSVQISERRNSNSGFDIALSELEGLTGSGLSSNGPVKFSIRRDAGSINFEGTIRSGVGAGTFDFTPSATFGAEMAKRGYERPSNEDLYILARGNVGAAYLDELASQKYTRPSLDELLRASDHGVDLEYLRDMGRAGFHLGQVELLVRTRDHGVDREFIDGLKAHGLTGLSIDDLVRARDHGVDPEYIDDMKRAGFDLHGLDNLVRTRDHGVDPDYISEMKSAGYDLHDIDGLIRARDHGVDAGYIKGMSALGFRKLTLERLIAARDHGVDTEYIESMRRHGYNLDLDELIDARNHGVDPDFVSAFIAIGYKNLTIDELVRLRDHGVSASWAKRQNRDGSRMPVDELIRRRDRGGDN
jgi:beta-lactamase regulating signal transducer with metallopeptidase domain